MDSQTALTELKKFQGERKGAGDYYNQSQQELGVGEAQTRQNELKDVIRNTEAQLKGVGQSVAGRTRGNLVTEAQRSRLQALEERPIAESLGSQQGAYSDAAQNYRDLLGQAGTKAGMLYQTDADKLSALESTYNKQYAAEQAAKAEEQWRQQFEESRRQSESALAEQQRQFNENIANTKAQYANLASLYNPSITTPTVNTEQQKAIQDEASRLAKVGLGSFSAGLPINKTKKQSNNILGNIGQWWNSLPTSSLFGIK